MEQPYSFRKLLSESLNPKSSISSKRVSLLVSQVLFALQIFADIVLHAILLIWIEPLPSVEFYTVMSSVQGLGLLLNAIIIFYNIGAIKKTDVADLLRIYSDKLSFLDVKSISKSTSKKSKSSVDDLKIDIDDESIKY